MFKSLEKEVFKVKLSSLRLIAKEHINGPKIYNNTKGEIKSALCIINCNSLEKHYVL